LSASPVALGAVDVLDRTEPSRQLLLVPASVDRDGPEAHLVRELDREVPDPTDALDRDGGTRSGMRVPQRVERGGPGTHQRRRLLEGQPLGNPRQRVLRCHDVFGVPTVVRHTDDRAAETVGEVTPPAVLAGEVDATGPADADPLADLPDLDPCTDRVDDPGDLVPRDPRQLGTEQGVAGNRVATADTAGVHLHPDLPRPGLRYRHVDHYKRSTGLLNLGRAHCRCHRCSLSLSAFRRRRPTAGR
jgi:hypothetical protein